MAGRTSTTIRPTFQSDIIAAAKTLYESGVPGMHIARRFGIRKSAFYAMAVRNGWKFKIDYSEIPNEQWKPIKGCDGIYSVSDHGRVRRDTAGKDGTPAGKLMAVRTTGMGGYPAIMLRIGRVRTTHFVHALVAAAFIGPRPEGLQINHINGVKTDSRPANLEYVTHSQNAFHSVSTGLSKIIKGEKHGMAKITDATASIIKQRLGAGVSLQKIALELGVSLSTVKRIHHGTHWRHVP